MTSNTSRAATVSNQYRAVGRIGDAGVDNLIGLDEGVDYRHFSSANDLVAAAFMSLIPPAPMPPEEGSLRERLTAIVGA